MVIYQDEWNEFQKQKNKHSFENIFIILLFGVLIWISPEQFYLTALFLLVWFGYEIVKYVKRENWKCPKCREDFQLRIPSKEHREFCLNCKMPVYYGSVYFEDYWGEEKAKVLIEKQENKVSLL